MVLEFGDLLVYVVTIFGLYTATIFVLTLIQGRKTLMKFSTKWKPKVGVIVPCYNEEKTVKRTLRSLLDLNYPRNKLDIIVVDDGSTDNTYKVAKKFEKLGVRVFKKKNGGKYSALNHGLERTDAEVVGALDADSFVDKEALNRILPYFGKNVMAVTPAMKIYSADNWLRKVQMLEYLVGIFLRKVFTLMGSNHVTPGPFTLYKKEMFDKHGPYREAYLTEDIEMALRMQRHNYQVENAHDAYVYTVGPRSFKTLYKQRLRWYYGFIQNCIDYKDLFSYKHGNLGLFVLPAAFASVLVVIVALFYTLFRTLSGFWDKYIWLRAIEFDWARMFRFKFDTFFITMNETMILSILTLVLSLGLIMLAKKIAAEKEKIRYAYVFHALTYWLLYGFWWLAAIFYKVTGLSTKWGHKSSV